MAARPTALASRTTTRRPYVRTEPCAHRRGTVAPPPGTLCATGSRSRNDPSRARPRRRCVDDARPPGAAGLGKERGTQALRGILTDCPRSRDRERRHAAQRIAAIGGAGRRRGRSRTSSTKPEAPSSDEGRPNDGHVGMLLCAAAPCRSADPRRRVPRAPGPRRGRNGAACYSAARPSWSGSMRSGPRFTVWRGCCRAPRAAGSSPPPGRPQSGTVTAA